jgi:type I restriction enzyme R subunit
MTGLNESHIEEAALAWLESLGWAVVHGPEIAPGEPKRAARPAAGRTAQ